jgi:FAD/FMN-containing dehydrogenase
MHYPQSNNDFWNDLTSHTQGDVRTDLYSRVLYSTDASIYQVMPHGLFLPKSSEDVQTAVSLAAAYNMPILARTAGSSLAGQAVNEALIIDFTRHLDQILELNVEEKWVRVQPGVVLDNLNAFLRPYQLQFGPDPASANRAGMGGIISNNATGSHSILYGMAADHLLKANVILSDGSATLFGALSPEVLRQKAALSSAEGRIYKQVDALVIDAANQAIIRTHTPRHWRRCGGYNLDRLLPPDGQIIYHRPPQDSQFNLAKLFSGAEGTLGIITELTLKLVPVPRNTAVAIVEFDDLHTALTAVPQLLETSPSAIELMDYRQLNLCRQNREYARLLATFVEGEPTCILITEFYGSSDSECRAKLEKLQQTIRKQGVRATAVTPLLDPQRQQNVWQVRKGGLGLLMSMKGDYKPLPFIEDAAVPVEHLDEYVTKLEQFCAALGTEISYYAHASAGCLHIRPIIDAKQAREVVKLPQIAQFAVDLLKGYGGAWSSEHGDGRSRSWLNSFLAPNCTDCTNKSNTSSILKICSTLATSSARAA